MVEPASTLTPPAEGKTVECESAPSKHHTKSGRYCGHCGEEVNPGKQPPGACTDARHTQLKSTGMKFCWDCQIAFPGKT